MEMSWAEIEQMCRRSAKKDDLFFEAEWDEVTSAESFFAQLDSFDREQVRRFLDAQITHNRPKQLASQLISKVDEESESVLFHKIFWCDDNGEEEKIPELFARLFAVVTDVFRFPEDLWEIGKKCPVPLEQLFLRIPFWSYERYGNVFYTFYDRVDYENIVRPMRQWKTVDDSRYDLLNLRERELEIRWSLISDREAKERVFAKNALSFYECFFQKELLQQDDSNLPSMLRNALRIIDERGGKHYE